MELNFEGLKMQKLNTPTDRDQRVYEKNGIFWSKYSLCSWSYGRKNVSNGSFYVSSGDGSKKLK